jgi:hypothetical protein
LVAPREKQETHVEKGEMIIGAGSTVQILWYWCESKKITLYNLIIIRRTSQALKKKD